MFMDISGGTSSLAYVLFIAHYAVKRTYFAGRSRVLRHKARGLLLQSAPVGRLNIDGETYV